MWVAQDSGHLLKDGTGLKRNVIMFFRFGVKRKRFMKRDRFDYL